MDGYFERSFAVCDPESVFVWKCMHCYWTLGQIFVINRVVIRTGNPLSVIVCVARRFVIDPDGVPCVPTGTPH